MLLLLLPKCWNERTTRAGGVGSSNSSTLVSVPSFLFFSFLFFLLDLDFLFLPFSLSLIPIPFLDRRMTSIHNSNSSAAHSQGQNLVTELCCCCCCCWLMCVAETLWVDSSSRALISTDAEPTKRLMMPSTKLNSQTESKAKASLPPPPNQRRQTARYRRYYAAQ